MPVLMAQLYSPSLELIMLLIALFSNALLAFAVYQGNPRSATNRIFALLALSTSLWLANTYIVREPGLFTDSLTLHRFGIFFAAIMSALFFLLAHTFPAEKIRLTRVQFFAVLSGTFVMLVANLSPYAFVDIVATSSGISEPIPGFGLIPFGLISTLYCILAFYVLIQKYRRDDGVVKRQIRLVLIGMATMIALIIGTILVPIILFNSLIFLPFTPLYALAFLSATGYAITTYQLFNVKVLLTQALVLLLCVVLFSKIFGSETESARLVSALIFLCTTVVGYFLVKSVKREVEQRMLIEAQEKELESANARQENLLHFISHEIKGYLTDGQGALAAIVDGDFGESPPPVRDVAKTALTKMRTGVSTIMDILAASNFKKGSVSFAHDVLNVRDLVEDAVIQLRPMAAERGLMLELTVDSAGAYTMQGDAEKLERHVIRNLIDNALRYTMEGSIHVTLTHDAGAIVLSVKDTGVGISPDDKAHLFTEGGHGKESIKINVHSTGYGLFIAKQIVDAHKGTIEARSAGTGKGSEFIVRLPASV